MVVTSFLGSFNDNFFKQAMLLLAVSLGMNELQGRIVILFSLSFLLFSAWGGWMADRFAKKRVMIWVKLLELGVMITGAYGVLTLNWYLVLSMIFFMGSQSALFSPALNGAVPELCPPEQVNRANSFIKSGVTGAALLGMAIAGFALDQHWFETAVPFGRVLVAAVMVLVGLLGLLCSFAVFSKPASGARCTFPWIGPMTSVRDLVLLKNDPLLLLTLCTDSFFYFVSVLILLVINTLGLQQLQLDTSRTALLSVALTVGVSLGALLAGRIAAWDRWAQLLLPAAIGMGTSIIAAGLLVEYGGGSLPVLLGLLTLAGAFGGLFLVPLTTFMQIRPAHDRKGRVLSVDNFSTYFCMVLAGLAFSQLDRNLAPSVSLIVLGTLFAFAGGGLASVLHHMSKKPETVLIHSN